MKGNRAYSLQVITLLISLLAGAAIFFEWENPLRWVLVILFLLFCPGIAFSHLLPGKDQITRIILIVALSLALDTAIAELVLYLGKWSSRLILLILMELCWLGLLSQIPIKISISKPAIVSSMLNKNVQYYTKLIKHGWWLILMSVLVAANLSLVYSYYVATPLYDAIAQFIVSPNPSQMENQGSENSLKSPDKTLAMAAYANLINSQQFTNDTINFLHEDPKKFTHYASSVKTFPETNIIELSIKGPNPEVATMLANSLGQNAIIRINTLNTSYNINFLNKASIPSKPFQPRPAQDAGIALLFGIFVGVCLAISRDQLTISW